MSKRAKSQKRPMGIVHKRVLNALENDPEAPSEKLSASVSGATPELVDRIRDEFSDELQSTSQQEKSELSALNPLADQDTDSTVETAGSETDESELIVDTPTEGEGEEETAMSDGSDDAQNGSDQPNRSANTESSTLTETTLMTIDDTSESSVNPDEASQTGLHNQPDEFSASTPIPDDHSLSNKQLTTLQAIYENPEASQRELADVLGVDHSTIAYRVSTIDDFQWDSRQAFVNSFFESGVTDEGDMAAVVDTDEKFIEEIKQQLELPDEYPGHVDEIEVRLDELNATISEFNQRIGDLIDQIQTVQDTSKQAETRIDSSMCPEVAHLIIQACMEHEAIGDEEEREIIQSLLDL